MIRVTRTSKQTGRDPLGSLGLNSDVSGRCDLPPIARTLGLARHAFLGLFGREIPES
jgi:hypothetical protein